MNSPPPSPLERLKAVIRLHGSGFKAASAATLELREKYPDDFIRICKDLGLNPELLTLEGSYLSRYSIDPTNEQAQAQAVTIDALLESRRYDHSSKPPIDRAIYLLGQQTVIATPGNLCTISAAVKTGKSAAVGGMIAAAISESDGADCLGFTSDNPDGFAVLSFDTEQSKLDHWLAIQRILKRANLKTPPGCFYSYHLAGLTPAQVVDCTKEAVRRARESHGGIHSVFLDGVADYVADVNDAIKCNELVATLHGMAIEFDCTIVCVIHFNPGSDKTRGHLGSQLTRKAETNLQLEKDGDDVTVIWSDKQRRAPIPKDSGPCFAWSDEHEMHITVENPAAAEKRDNQEASREALAQVVSKMFSAGQPLRYTDMVNFLVSKDGLGVSRRTATRKLEEVSRLGLIVKRGNLYSLKGLQ